MISPTEQSKSKSLNLVLDPFGHSTKYTFAK